MKTLPIATLCGCLLAGTATAQTAKYELDPAVRIGNSFASTVTGKAGQAFLVLWDGKSGPIEVLQETLWVGLGGSFLLGRTGVLDSSGKNSLKIPVPPSQAYAGVILFGQALLVDKVSPNGVFRLSNGESTIVHNEANVLVDRFDDPKAAGFLGTFDGTIKGRLMAGAQTRRLVRPLAKAGGTPFTQPIKGPLEKYGSRIQMVYRAKDLGGTGEPEALTAVHWRPFGGKVQSDSYARWVIDVGHTTIVPDYTIDKFSQLPVYPKSGLGTTFALNQKTGEKQVRWVDGPYAISPNSLRKDGYLPYPTPKKSFVWNGTESLLLDFKIPVSLNSNALNGQQVNLMVLTLAQPNSRAFKHGNGTSYLDPFNTFTAYNADNSLNDYQFEFTRIQSTALSPWIDSKRAVPDYQSPLVAASIPAGTSLQIEYQGAQDKLGTGATAFSTDIDKADGMPWLRYRVTFRSNELTGQRPSIDTIAIPAR